MYYLKKLICIFLVIITILIPMEGCVSSNTPDTSSDNYNADYTNLAFEAYTDSLFQSMVSSNTLTLHSFLKAPVDFGIKNYKVTLGEYNPDSAVYTNELVTCINDLKSFDYDNLSSSQKITYKEILQYFETELEYSDLYMFGTSLSPTTGIQISLPLIFSEYSFDCEEDIRNYLELIRQTKDYFPKLIELEKKRAQLGIFMEDVIADKIIDQCQIFVESASDGYLITTFNDRIDALNGLSENSKKTYKSQNKDAVSNFLMPAYTQLVNDITALKGSNEYPGGLCNSPNGNKYYEYLLKSELGWSKSIDELYKLLSTYTVDAFSQMAVILDRNPNVLNSSNAFSFKLTDPQEILSDLKVKIAKDFPESPEINYNIKYVSKGLEEYSSPAMYFTPQLDNLRENVIYINKTNSDEQTLYSTLAHEGFPGHMYQTTYFASKNPDYIRNILKPSGYVEGWASYCELYSYTMADSDNPDLNRMMQANFQGILSVYSMVDIGVNYYGWDLQKTKDFLAGYGFGSADVAREMYYAMIAEPGNYPKYSLGLIAFCELKKQAENFLGDDFDIKEFHEFLLDLGPVWFDIAEDELQKWLNSNQ